MAERESDVGNMEERESDVGNMAERESDVGNMEERESDVGNMEERESHVANMTERESDVGNMAERESDVANMAQQQEGVVLDEEQLCCSICQDLLTEPVVTLPGGHSYCSRCVQTHLQPHHSGPAAKKRKLVVQGAAARPQDKVCSSHNNKPLEVYCRTDQQCICYLCVMEEHKGHDTVSAAAESAEKQKQLAESIFKVQERVQEREKELKALGLAVETLKSSAQTAVKASDEIFSEMIRSIQTRCKEVKDLIGAQEKTAVSQAEGVLKQLEQEIEELRRRGVELEQLEQLEHTDDHIHFIQAFQSFSSPSVYPDLPSIAVHPLRDFRNVSDAVSELRDELTNILKDTWPKISAEAGGDMEAQEEEMQTEKNHRTGDEERRAVLATSGAEGTRSGFKGLSKISRVAVLLPPKPGTRDSFLQHACPLSLDPNTMKNTLSLSVQNRKVTGSQNYHRYADHPERFTDWRQVLCREGQSARCYWEVKWTGSMVLTAVCYKDIRRKGGAESRFGLTNKSWCLQSSYNGDYWFRHNNVHTRVSGPRSSRIGMYLDHKAGTLSFYSVSDTMTLLHTVQTTFTQALYPGIQVSCNATAELMNIW